MRISVTVTVLELRSLNMRRMRIWHSPFFVNLSKRSKRIEVPEKEWYPKEKSRWGG